jgi:hypothetical protein
MMNRVTRLEMSLAFSHFFVTTLLLDFNDGVPGFGSTIVTAYAFEIFAPVTFVVICSEPNVLLLVIALGWTFAMFCEPRSVAGRRAIVSCMSFSALVILVKSFRPAPFWPENATLDRVLGLGSASNTAWIATFSIQYLLISMFWSQDYQEVKERQERRRDCRRIRQVIFRDIDRVDSQFTELGIRHALKGLQCEFDVLTNDVTFNVSMPFIPTIAPAVQGPSKPLLIALLDTVKPIFLRVVDFVLCAMMHASDVNLEPGVSTPAIKKLFLLIAELADQYKESSHLMLPDEYAEFAQSIPYSFALHFRTIGELHQHDDWNGRRVQLFKWYFATILRTIVPFLLVLLAAFYPLKEASFIAFGWSMIAIISVGLKISGYIQYFVYATAVMLIRYIILLPGLDEFVRDARYSVGESQRGLPLFVVFGLNAEGRFLLDATLLIFSMLSMGIRRSHPTVEPYQTGKTATERFCARFNTTTGRNLRISVLIFLLDFLGLILLLFAYGSWHPFSSSVGNLVSGSSDLSAAFVAYLAAHFCFIVLVQIAVKKRAPMFYIFSTYLNAIVSYLIIFFAIPADTESYCFTQASYRFYLFLRISAQLLMAVHLNVGFHLVLPEIPKQSHITTICVELFFQYFPFLFEIVTVMKWIASKTTMPMWNYMVVEILKTKLIERQAINKLWPEEKQVGRIEGVAFLVIIIALLFVPLLIMTSSSSTSKLNPATVLEIDFGVSGLPSLYEGQFALDHTGISADEQAQIKKLNDNTLSEFVTVPVDQIQQIVLPFGSMQQWSVSPDAIASALAESCNSSSFIPFARLTISFRSPTTRNQAENLRVSQEGSPFNYDQCMNLTRALEGKDTQILVPSFLRMFLNVKYTDDATWAPGYDYDITLSHFAQPVPYWRMEASLTRPVPEFIKQNIEQKNRTTIIVGSAKVPDDITGSLLSSTGGLIGLYSFVLITIGQWVMAFTSSLFTDLWLSRMQDPVKLLHILFALEAYEMMNEGDQEFMLSEQLLESLRTVPKVVQMTDIRSPETEL